MAASTRRLVIFDGDCGVCAQVVEWMQRFASNYFEFVPHQMFDSGALAALGLTRERCHRAMQCFDPGLNGFVEGPQAFHAVLGSHRLFAPLVALILRVPGAALVENLAYRLFATHRHRVSAALGLTACRIDTKSG